MKDNQHCTRKSRRARQFDANPVQLKNEGTGCGNGRKNLTTQENITTKTMTGYIEKTYGQVSVSASGTRPAQTSMAGIRPAWTNSNWRLADNHLHGRSRRTLLNNFVKNRISLSFSLSLGVVLGAAFISVRAADNPAQAAARVALEQKMYELDHRQSPPPIPVTPSAAVMAQSAASATRTVSAKTVTPQTTAPPTTPAAAPAPVAPADVAPAVAVSAAVAPAMSPRIVSPLIVSFFIASLLIVSFLLLKLRQLKLKLREMDYRA
ncbi:MAG: hypothetical protein ABSG80_05890 [Verrucomicrobiota bacterium]